jgi:Domain of unknown function (DUF5916)/Carbohydrate family 9 binding domain-like
MPRIKAHAPRLFLLILCLCLAPPLFASGPEFGSIQIPRISSAPRLDEFLNMEAPPRWKGKLAKVDKLTQRIPTDGAPATQKTEIYLGYDDKNLYVIFVCFDTEPRKVRAHLSRRDDVFDDDTVEIMLDTFHDHRRAYAFNTNPLGVQADALWTEGADFDISFDTVWNSAGKLTDRGFVVWIAIPFRSLRFASNDPQTWGILLNREIPRNSEDTFWPPYSSRIQGRLNQEGTATGIEKISPGRNLQLIPYGLYRSFKELDLTDPNHPTYSQRTAFGQMGLDAKVVLKDKFVLDMTANPDFSQIESDQPQVTVNQRFEVFFPEKRPFFLENSNYFQTPIQLLFTRRIVDPKWGVRLTGKDGPWAVAALVADTASPSERVTPPGNPIFNQHALFAIGRVSRDIGTQSSIGVMYADKEVNGFFNRVGSVDGRFTLNSHWVASAQAAYSATINPSDPLYNMFNTTGSYQSGSAAEVVVQRQGRKLNYALDYSDRSPNFRTLTGFDPQPDIRNLDQRLQYSFRPEGKHLISWGPAFENYETYDHEGNRINSGYSPSLLVELIGQTLFTAQYAEEMERLRPQDFSVLTQIEKYTRHTTVLKFESNYSRKLGIHADYRFGTRVNYDPPYDPNRLTNYYPFMARRTSANVTVTLRPNRSLKVDNSYLLLRLRQCAYCANPQPELARPYGSMNNHIVRSRWNYQFTKELSFRFIGQYDAVLANPHFTYLQTARNFNADFLFAYLVHPSTALYVGYNSNLENIDEVPQPDGLGGVNHVPGRLRNDGRNFFVKASYLFRF